MKLFNILGHFFLDIAETVIISLAGANLSLCSDKIFKISKDSKIISYPNPIVNNLNITINNNELSEIILYDITSRIILNREFTNSILINTEQLSKGIYFYEIKNKYNLKNKKEKVVKD